MRPGRLLLRACTECIGYYPDADGAHPGVCGRCDGTGLLLEVAN